MPQTPEPSPIPFVYFGSSRLSVIVLDELLKRGFTPSLIVTTPDKPQGRKLIITPNIVKTWALEHHIPVLNPVKLDDVFLADLHRTPCDLFIVASYGKIIPTVIIELPKYKTLNIHPSLLPQYRGASPLPTAILEDTKKTGVSIMQLDTEMDHGPIIAQKEINITDHFKEWPTYPDFEAFMAREGAQVLANILPDWVQGNISIREQNHSQATYTKKISKDSACIDFSQSELKNTDTIAHDRAYSIFRKIQAFNGWLDTYFFIEHNEKKMRVKITEASFENNHLNIKKVIPEGKKEISYSDFKKNYLL